jgi:hypothetical protein
VLEARVDDTEWSNQAAMKVLIRKGLDIDLQIQNPPDSSFSAAFYFPSSDIPKLNSLDNYLEIFYCILFFGKYNLQISQ